jgi:hypothetical protein
MPNMKNLLETIDMVVSEKKTKYSFTEEEYNQKYEAFTSGKLSRDEWTRYATAVLEKIMSDNKDVFIRLKNR